MSRAEQNAVPYGSECASLSTAELMLAIPKAEVCSLLPLLAEKRTLERERNACIGSAGIGHLFGA